MPDAIARVLDVGNCDMDHARICRLLVDGFDTAVDRARDVDEALRKMREHRYDLVLFNRLIFADGSEGIELLRRAKADDALRQVPIMMVSNDAEAQSASEAAGGEPGFGKEALAAPSTRETLSGTLPRK